MFNNIGSKIMKLAKVICWIGIIVSVISGAIMIVGGASLMSNSSYGSYGPSGSPVSTIVVGVCTIIFGCLFSWIGSFFTYGFGRLIENTDILRDKAQNKE